MNTHTHSISSLPRTPEKTIDTRGSGVFVRNDKQLSVAGAQGVRQVRTQERRDGQSLGAMDRSLDFTVLLMGSQ